MLLLEVQKKQVKHSINFISFQAITIYITNTEGSLESKKPTPSLIKKDNKKAQEEPLLSEDTKKLIKVDDDVVNNKTVTKTIQKPFKNP